MDLGKRKTPDLSAKRFFWLRSQIPIQIAKPVRENSLQFSECNCFGAFVEIVGQHHLVIIQENGVENVSAGSAESYSAKPSKADSGRMPSAPEEITSVPETTRTLLFLSGTL